MSYTYQWKRCATDGTGCVDIPGATSADYVTDAGGADEGFTFVCQVTDGAGTVALSDPPWPPGGVVGAGGDPGGSFGSALNAWIATIFGSPWTSDGHLPDSTGSVVSVSTVSGLSAAIAAATSGTIIELAAGTYDFNAVSYVQISKTWSASNPVTIRPANGATVILTNSGTTAAKRIFYIVNTTGLRIMGHSADGTGCMYADGGAAGGTPGNAIKWDGNCNDIEINGFDATRINGVAFLLDATSGANNRFAFWNCRAYNNGDHGYYLGSWGSNTTAPYSISGLLVANCLGFDNYARTAGAGQGYGFQIGDSVKHARIVNCTADNNGANSGREGGYVLFTQSTLTSNMDRGTDVVFANCIATNNLIYGFDSAGPTPPHKATNTVTYSLGFGNGTADLNPSPSMWVAIAPNLHGDPMYANRAGKDFTPSSSGAAHDVGDPDWMPATDINGVARVTADVGALVSA